MCLSKFMQYRNEKRYDCEHKRSSFLTTYSALFHSILFCSVILRCNRNKHDSSFLPFSSFSSFLFLSSSFSSLLGFFFFPGFFRTVVVFSAAAFLVCVGCFSVATVLCLPSAGSCPSFLSPLCCFLSSCCC